MSNFISIRKTLVPLTQKDLPRNLRSTRRLSACNMQITAEMQQKLLKASSKVENKSNDSYSKRYHILEMLSFDNQRYIVLKKSSSS